MEKLVAMLEHMQNLHDLTLKLPRVGNEPDIYQRVGLGLRRLSQLERLCLDFLTWNQLVESYFFSNEIVESLAAIYPFMPKLKSFALNLSSNCIDDHTLQQSVLPNLPRIQTL